MANTYTKIVDNTTLAAAGSAESNKVETALQTGTGVYALELVVRTSNGLSGNQSKIVRVWFVTTNENVDPAAVSLRDIFGLYAKSFDLEVKFNRSSVTVRSSVPFVPTGSILYTWLEHSPGSTAVAADLWLTEVPQT